MAMLQRRDWRWLAAALCVAPLAWWLALQAPATLRLQPGGDALTRQRWHDAPYLSGFNAPEPADAAWWQAPLRWRWAGSESRIRAPWAGGGPWRADLTLASGRADGSAIALHLVFGDTRSTVVVGALPRRYRLLGPARAGVVDIVMHAPRYQVPGDPRDLGLVMVDAELRALPGWRHADAASLGWLLVIVAVAAVAGVATLPRGRRALPAWAAVLTLTAVTLGWRFALGVAIPAYGWLALASLPLLLLVRTGVRRLCPDDPHGAAAAAGAWALGFVVRLAGVLHPGARFSDLGLHVNHLARVLGGDLLFTTGLPCEAGAGPQPYPPALYILLAPARLLVDDSRQSAGFLLQGGVAALESLGAVACWFLLRRAGVAPWGAAAAALVYAVLPATLRSYSVGELTNLFGQALIAPVLVVLALGERRQRLAAVAGGLLVLAILLGHTGATLSLLACAGAWLLLSRLAGAWPRRVLVIGIGMVVLAALGYYSAFGDVPAAREQAARALAAQGVRCPPGIPVGDKLIGVLGGALASNALLPPLALVAGLAGAWLLRMRAARHAVLAAWLGVVLSLATLLVSDQAVRWQLFLTPAVAIGVGATAAALRRRGRAGAGVALGLLGSIVLLSLIRWIDQVVRYLH